MTLQQKAAYLYHDPSQVEHVAYLAHNIPGFILIGLAILIFLAGIGVQRKLLTYFIASSMVGMSVVGIAVVFLNKGIRNLPLVAELVFAHPMISVHVVQAIAAIIGGIVEILYENGRLKNKFFHIVFPLSFIIIGYTNILHPQEGSHLDRDMFLHALMGSLLIATGYFLTLQRLLTKKAAFWSLMLGCASLVIVGGIFGTYRDSPDAYVYAFPQPAIQPSQFVDGGSHGIMYIYQNRIIPKNMKIKKDGDITFILVDGSWHDIASGPHPQHTEYPPLNIGFLMPREQKTISFPNTGEHGYHDHIHETNQDLQGTILVTD